MKSFVEFIRKQGVVGLAIAFIMGASITKVITALVTDIVNPFVGLFLEHFASLEKLTFKIGSAQFLVGDFISALIDFIIVAFVVYGLFEFLQLKKLDRKEEKEKK